MPTCAWSKLRWCSVSGGGRMSSGGPRSVRGLLSLLDPRCLVTSFRSPVLDRGFPRRMWVADALRAFASCALIMSLLLAGTLFIIATVIGASVFLSVAILVCGVVLITPAGCVGIAIAWRITIGLGHSARLRRGDFRFAGAIAPLVVWGCSLVAEYVMHLRAGHAIVWAILWPLVLGMVTTWSALQGRRRLPRPRDLVQ